MWNTKHVIPAKAGIQNFLKILDSGFRRNDRQFVFIAAVLLFSLLLSFLVFAKEKPKHPFDIYDHEMHNGFFEMASVPCETCHADPASFGNRAKINKQGCHTCHNNPNPPAPATQECTLCHFGGKFPKPQTHKTAWIEKHQFYAKDNAKECATCHSNNMFCINCHQRRDTVQEEMHRRNFRFYHSIEARANPRKCDSCHTTHFCQECHAGRESSKK